MSTAGDGLVRATAAGTKEQTTTDHMASSVGLGAVMKLPAAPLENATQVDEHLVLTHEGLPARTAEMASRTSIFPSLPSATASCGWRYVCTL